MLLSYCLVILFSSSALRFSLSLCSCILNRNISFEFYIFTRYETKRVSDDDDIGHTTYAALNDMGYWLLISNHS
jgi:hypothetical protein